MAAFSLLNPLAVYPPCSRSGAEPTRVLLLATATDFLAVGGGVGTAMGINAVSSGWWAWVLAPFCAGLVYVLVQCIELTVGQHTDEATRTLRLLPAAADGGSPHLPEGP